jgi:hypothetical protein
MKIEDMGGSNCPSDERRASLHVGWRRRRVFACDVSVISRRDLLRSASLLIAAIFVAVRPSLRNEAAERREISFEKWLREVFPDLEAVRSVGACYLRLHAEEANCARLHELLFASAGLPPRARVAGWMSDRRALEFADEDVVVVAGWILGRSEARLCALATMTVATS